MKAILEELRRRLRIFVLIHDLDILIIAIICGLISLFCIVLIYL